MRYLADETASTPGTEMWRIWQSGDYWGSRRPVARATVQKVVLHEYGHDNGLFRSLLFNQSQVPSSCPTSRASRSTGAPDYGRRHRDRRAVERRATALRHCTRRRRLSNGPAGTPRTAGRLATRGATRRISGRTTWSRTGSCERSRVTASMRACAPTKTPTAPDRALAHRRGLAALRPHHRADLPRPRQDPHRTAAVPARAAPVDYPIYFTASAAASHGPGRSPPTTLPPAHWSPPARERQNRLRYDRSRAVNVAAAPSHRASPAAPCAAGAGRCTATTPSRAPPVALWRFHWPRGRLHRRRALRCHTTTLATASWTRVIRVLPARARRRDQRLARSSSRRKPIMDAVT
jgi:hypothetical protein